MWLNAVAHCIFWGADKTFGYENNPQPSQVQNGSQWIKCHQGTIFLQQRTIWDLKWKVQNTKPSVLKHGYCLEKHMSFCCALMRWQQKSKSMQLECLIFKHDPKGTTICWKCTRKAPQCGRALLPLCSSNLLQLESPWPGCRNGKLSSNHI